MSGLHPYFSHLVHADLTVKTLAEAMPLPTTLRMHINKSCQYRAIKPAKKTLLLDTVSRIHCGKTGGTLSSRPKNKACRIGNMSSSFQMQ